ncbi:MAG: hypothetical protein ACRD4U_04170, partial [Candidatus Acidiferrales bacterium]
QQQFLELIRNLKAELEEAEARLQQTDVPVAVLDEFKSAVDHMRLTLLGISHSSGEDKYEAAAAILRSRMLHVVETCKQIVSDIDAREITVESAELKELHDTLSGTVLRIHQLYKTGN